MNLYAAKGAVNARLLPLVDRLAAAGVTPDEVTLAAVPVAVLGGAPAARVAAGPVRCCSLCRSSSWSGSCSTSSTAHMARRTGRTHPRGELYNEVGDRLADVAFLAPVAWLPGAVPEIVLLGVLGGVLASYVGITARAAGGERIYRGVLSKPGRMALLCVCCVWAWVAGPGDGLAWTVFGPLLLLGTVLTLLERIAVAIRRLD